MSDVIHGYLVRGENGKFLDKDLRWSASYPREGHIFDPERLPEITKAALNWDIKPITLHPVSYGEGKGFRSTGNTMPYPVWFWKITGFFLWFKENSVHAWFASATVMAVFWCYSLFFGVELFTKTFQALVFVTSFFMFFSMAKNIIAFKNKDQE